MTYIENVEDNLSFNHPREFGDLITSPLNFFFRNFSGLMAPMLKFAAPIIVVGMIFLGFAINSLIKNTAGFGDINSISYNLSYISISVLLIGFGYVMALAVIYSYASLYQQRGGKFFSEDEVRSLAFSSYLSLIVAQILKALIIAGGFFLFVIGAIYFAIALTYVDFIIVHERANPIEAIRKSFSISSGYWWKTFGVLFIVQLILGFSMQIIYIPMIAISASVGFMGGSEMAISILAIVLGIIIFILSVIVYSIPNIATIYLFFNKNLVFYNPDLEDRVYKMNSDFSEKRTDEFNRF